MMSKKKRKNKKRKLPPLPQGAVGRCRACEQPLFKKGGYGGTGMCGPCCTGEAETLEEVGISW
jgi:hypothetical protein